MMRELMNGFGVGPVELIAGAVLFAAVILLCRELYRLAWPSQPHKRAETPAHLVNRAEHKRRVEQNRLIAMGRVREMEQRRAS